MAGLTLHKADRELALNLGRFLREGGGNTFVMLSGNHAMTFRAGKGAGTLLCETSSEGLEKHGFTKAKSAFRRTLEGLTEARIPNVSREIVRYFIEGFGCAPDQAVRFEVVLENYKHPGNPELVKALANLKRKDSPGNRERFYISLVNALLLVPTDPDDPDSKRILQLSAKDGSTHVPIFTDEGSADRFRKEGITYLAMPGAHLFLWARNNGTPSFALNAADPSVAIIPRSDIEMLARAAEEWMNHQQNRPDDV